MALTRAQIKEILSTAGVDDAHMDSAITAILNGHTATVDALKEERDGYKTAADELPKVKKQLEELQKNAAEGGSYKEKYDSLKTEYDKYKNEQSAKETKAKKTEAFKKLLKDAGVNEKHINAVLRASDVDSIEFGDDGKVKDAEDKMKTIKEEWSDFIVSEGSKGTTTANPPGDNGGKHGSGIGAEIAKQYMAEHYGVKSDSDGNKGDGGK